MTNQNETAINHAAKITGPNKNGDRGSSRRKFLGQVGAALAGGAVFGRSAIAAAQSDNSVSNDLITPLGSDHSRVEEAKRIRVNCANREAHIHVPPHTTNGDEQRYHDKSGTYSKGLLQDGIGLVNLAAYQSLRHAIDRGRFQDFENIIIGGTRRQNGPLGAIAFTLEGCDGVQLGNAPCPEMQISQVVVPPAPAAASEAYGTELIEMYWAALLRDVAFSDYPSNSIAGQAAAELTSQPTYAGPRDASGHVTPNLLFRGVYPGDTLGPYVSQLHLIPTYFGTQPISQRLLTYAANLDYMTDPITFQQVQNGINTGLLNQADSQLRFLHNGRDLGAYTHLDVLFQAYFIAFLVLNTIHAPLNPGNPYVHSTKQNGFGTFGGPDIAATITAVARAALNNVWYQKWVLHMRHRPESGGALVRQILAGHVGTIQAHPHANVLNSQAVQSSFNRYGDYFLSQAFPEGSPTHPAYPTGHGAVGGACITALKFFFDGDFVIPNPVVPSSDGLSLLPYTGGDQLTVNGELNKIANNISFGHGILSGIHWRSDTSSSIQFGEAVAISILQDRTQAYPEPFTVRLRKIDETIATISNQ
jgi:hypothetical protein